MGDKKQNSPWLPMPLTKAVSAFDDASTRAERNNEVFARDPAPVAIPDNAIPSANSAHQRAAQKLLDAMYKGQAQPTPTPEEQEYIDQQKALQLQRQFGPAGL